VLLGAEWNQTQESWKKVYFTPKYVNTQYVEQYKSTSWWRHYVQHRNIIIWWHHLSISTDVTSSIVPGTPTRFEGRERAKRPKSGSEQENNLFQTDKACWAWRVDTPCRQPCRTRGWFQRRTRRGASVDRATWIVPLGGAAETNMAVVNQRRFLPDRVTLLLLMLRWLSDRDIGLFENTIVCNFKNASWNRRLVVPLIVREKNEEFILGKHAICSYRLPHVCTFINSLAYLTVGRLRYYYYAEKIV